MISKKFFGEGAVDNSQRVFDLVMRLTCISMLFVFAYGFIGKGRINRIEGGILLTSYIAYIGYLVMTTI